MPCSDCLRPNGEHAATCPNNDDFYGDEVMKTCPICGNEFNEEYFLNAVCDPCAFKAATYENALKFGKEEQTEIEINGFLAHCFTPEEIEELLIRELVDNGNMLLDRVRNKYVVSYCTDDIGAFADWLVELKGK